MPHAEAIARQPFRPTTFRRPNFVTPRRAVSPFRAGPAVDEDTGVGGLQPFQGGAPQPLDFGGFVRSGRRGIGQPAFDPAAGSRLTYDPNDPFGFLRGERASTYSGLTSRLIGQGGTEGFLNVNDPRLRELIRRRILAAGSARRARAGLASRLYGLDPYQARQALSEADIESSGQQFGDLNAADLELSRADQDFVRNLLMGERGFLGRQQAADAAELAAARSQAREQQQGGFGGFLGDVAGRGLSAAVPGLGRLLRGRREPYDISAEFAGG